MPNPVTKFCSEDGDNFLADTEECNAPGNHVVMLAYKKCPDVGNALGAAFGYATVMTTVIGAIIIFIFVKCKIVKEYTEEELKERNIEI
jgi:hypothetical protein